MKFCQKCWSEKLVQSPGLIICKGCGHSKKVLNIVVNSDVDTGLYGKRQISFITQKSAKNKMINENQNNGQRNEEWKQHIMSYQKSMKLAIQDFLNHHKVGNHQSSIVLQNLQQIWLKYLRRWKELDIPIDSIFTNPLKQFQDEQGLEVIEETDLKHQESQMEEQLLDSFQDEQLNTRSKRRRSSLLDAQILPDDPVIKEQQDQQQHYMPITKAQTVKYIRNLTLSMTMNKTYYFKKLISLKGIYPDIVLSTVRSFIKRLYYLYAVRQQNVKDMLHYLKFESLNPKLSWLRDMVKNRHQSMAETMTFENLSIYIFVYDLLQYKLGIKNTKNHVNLKKLIEKYNKKHQSELINVVLDRFKLNTQYQNIFIPKLKQQKTGLPPYLNFSLIYSFIQLALLRSKQTFYSFQILQHTLINHQTWLNTKYLRVNSTPSLSVFKQNSIDLIHTLSIDFKESNRGTWMDRIANEFSLGQYQNVLKVMVKTLVVKPDWVVNEQVECLAIVVMFCKLMGNMDQHANVAVAPIDRILGKYNIVKNQTYDAITKFHQKISKQISTQFQQQLKFNIRQIIVNINKSNKAIIKKKKFQKLSDLKDLTIKNFLQLRRQDELPFAEKQSYQKYKQIFSKKQQHIETPDLVTVTCKIQKSETEFKFRSYLTNEIPYKNENEILNNNDIILPSNNYQIIMDYRSNYYPLQKHQYMELLGAIAENRCTIDELYRKVEQLEKQIILFETQ